MEPIAIELNVYMHLGVLWAIIRNTEPDPQRWQEGRRSFIPLIRRLREQAEL